MQSKRFAGQHGDGQLSRVRARLRRRRRRGLEVRGQLEENPIWANKMTSLEVILAFLEDLFDCSTDPVGKLSNLRATLGSTKGALDEVLVGLKWVVKLEDVVQNAGSIESRSKCPKVLLHHLLLLLCLNLG